MALDLSKYGEPISARATKGLDLNKYGTPVATQEEPKQDGFFKDVYKKQ